MPTEYKMKLLYDAPVQDSDRSVEQVSEDFDRKLFATNAERKYNNQIFMQRIQTPNDVMPHYYRVARKYRSNEEELDEDDSPYIRPLYTPLSVRTRNPRKYKSVYADSDDEDVEDDSPYVHPYTPQSVRNRCDARTDAIGAQAQKDYMVRKDKDYLENRYTDMLVEKAKEQVRIYQDKRAKRSLNLTSKIEFHTYN